MSPARSIRLEKLSLVIGGARSGKSRYAESLAQGSGQTRTYVATAQAWDDEMRARIKAHQDDRGDGWTTIEAPLELAPVIHAARGVVLVDCATLWLTNLILGERDLAPAISELLQAIDQSAARIIIVSNEVGMSIVPENALARRFRDEQGRLNQILAQQAQLVVTVIAGLPLALKGPLP